MPETNGQIRRNCRVTELQLHLFAEGKPSGKVADS